VGQVTDFSLFLMVWHPAADLSDLPTKLGLEAARIWKIGEPRATSNGRPLEGVYRESYCGLNIEHDIGLMLPEAISSVIRRLYRNRALIAELRSSGGRFHLNVYWHSAFNTGEVFEPELLSALADIGLALGIDVYCDGEEESLEHPGCRSP
jgi:hypothetical protein